MILLVGALALATKQLNFGIDFESGTRIKVALVKPTDEEGVRETLDEAGIGSEEIQQVSDPVLGDNVFQIQSNAARTRRSQRRAQRRWRRISGSPKTASKAPASGRPSASRWPNSALKALIFSLLVICGYIALRFDPKFAVPVLIAIFHDILITAGVYALTGKEVSSGTVAAFLTILGYSIYDTIIVFDRIRENVPRMPRAAFSQIVNRSMSEVLTRSLATSFSTLLAVGSLLVFGGATLQDFAFAMLVGIALRYLLVDLHRLAGADRLEGTRAGLRRGGGCGSPKSRAACRPSPTTSTTAAARRATTRPKPRSPREASRRGAGDRGGAGGGAVATAERPQRRAPATAPSRPATATATVR